jgi:hypothetical protein
MRLSETTQCKCCINNIAIVSNSQSRVVCSARLIDGDGLHEGKREFNTALVRLAHDVDSVRRRSLLSHSSRISSKGVIR